MKRRDLVKRIARTTKDHDYEWTLERQGSNHSVYRLDGVVIPIPRHREINEKTAEGIMKECEIILGKRWWR